jgi:hypothetical protein
MGLSVCVHHDRLGVLPEDRVRIDPAVGSQRAGCVERREAAGQTLTRSAEFSPEMYARQAFGIVGGEAPITVRLLFEPKRHPSQRVSGASGRPRRNAAGNDGTQGVGAVGPVLDARCEGARPEEPAGWTSGTGRRQDGPTTRCSPTPCLRTAKGRESMGVLPDHTKHNSCCQSAHTVICLPHEAV